MRCRSHISNAALDSFCVSDTVWRRCDTVLQVLPFKCRTKMDRISQHVTRWIDFHFDVKEPASLQKVLKLSEGTPGGRGPPRMRKSMTIHIGGGTSRRNYLPVVSSSQFPYQVEFLSAHTSFVDTSPSLVICRFRGSWRKTSVFVHRPESKKESASYVWVCGFSWPRVDINELTEPFSAQIMPILRIISPRLQLKCAQEPFTKRTLHSQTQSLKAIASMWKRIALNIIRCFTNQGRIFDPFGDSV